MTDAELIAGMRNLAFAGPRGWWPAFFEFVRREHSDVCSAKPIAGVPQLTDAMPPEPRRLPSLFLLEDPDPVLILVDLSGTQVVLSSAVAGRRELAELSKRIRRRLGSAKPPAVDFSRESTVGVGSRMDVVAAAIAALSRMFGTIFGAAGRSPRLSTAEFVDALSTYSSVMRDVPMYRGSAIDLRDTADARLRLVFAVKRLRANLRKSPPSAARRDFRKLPGWVVSFLGWLDDRRVSAEWRRRPGKVCEILMKNETLRPESTDYARTFFALRRLAMETRVDGSWMLIAFSVDEDLPKVTPDLTAIVGDVPTHRSDSTTIPPPAPPNVPSPTPAPPPPPSPPKPSTPAPPPPPSPPKPSTQVPPSPPKPSGPPRPPARPAEISSVQPSPPPAQPQVQPAAVVVRRQSAAPRGMAEIAESLQAKRPGTPDLGVEEWTRDRRGRDEALDFLSINCEDALYAGVRPYGDGSIAPPAKPATPPRRGGPVPATSAAPKPKAEMTAGQRRQLEDLLDRAESEFDRFADVWDRFATTYDPEVPQPAFDDHYQAVRRVIDSAVDSVKFGDRLGGAIRAMTKLLAIVDSAPAGIEEAVELKKTAAGHLRVAFAVLRGLRNLYRRLGIGPSESRSVGGRSRRTRRKDRRVCFVLCDSQTGALRWWTWDRRGRRVTSASMMPEFVSGLLVEALDWLPRSALFFGDAGFDPTGGNSDGEADADLRLIVDLTRIHLLTTTDASPRVQVDEGAALALAESWGTFAERATSDLGSLRDTQG